MLFSFAGKSDCATPMDKVSHDITHYDYVSWKTGSIYEDVSKSPIPYSVLNPQETVSLEGEELTVGGGGREQREWQNRRRSNSRSRESRSSGCSVYF